MNDEQIRREILKAYLKDVSINFLNARFQMELLEKFKSAYSKTEWTVDNIYGFVKEYKKNPRKFDLIENRLVNSTLSTSSIDNQSTQQSINFTEKQPQLSKPSHQSFPQQSGITPQPTIVGKLNFQSFQLRQEMFAIQQAWSFLVQRRTFLFLKDANNSMELLLANEELRRRKKQIKLEKERKLPEADEKLMQLQQDSGWLKSRWNAFSRERQILFMFELSEEQRLLSWQTQLAHKQYQLQKDWNQFYEIDKAIREEVKDNIPLAMLKKNPNGDYTLNNAGEDDWTKFNATALMNGPSGEVYFKFDAKQTIPAIISMSREQIGNNSIQLGETYRIKVEGQQVTIESQRTIESSRTLKNSKRKI